VIEKSDILNPNPIKLTHGHFETMLALTLVKNFCE
jgi:hypothetical protein